MSNAEPQTSRRVACLVEYDGTEFSGLQRQRPKDRTIQDVIETSVRKLGETNPRFIAAGRTDAGVHAAGQVIAVDVPVKIPDHRLRLALNAGLPRDLQIRRAVTCAPDFSPRHDAARRHYLYRLSLHGPPHPLFRNAITHLPGRCEDGEVQAAADCFQGRFEFTAWRSIHCQATRTLLTIERAAAAPPDGIPGSIENCWRLRFVARSFLHHQVRLMAGAVAAVALGKLTVAELRGALAEGIRPKSVVMLPAHGLVFQQVDYPEDKDPFATT